MAMVRIALLYQSVKMRLPLTRYAHTHRARHKEYTDRARDLPRLVVCGQYARSEDNALYPRPTRVGSGVLLSLRLSHDRRDRRGIRQKNGEAIRTRRLNPRMSFLSFSSRPK